MCSCDVSPKHHAGIAEDYDRHGCYHASAPETLILMQWGLQASVRQSRELQAEWQHKYMSIQGESAIMKHELDDVRHHLLVPR